MKLQLYIPDIPHFYTETSIIIIIQYKRKKMDQVELQKIDEEEAKKAEEKYGALPRKKIRPAKDKKVLPDSVEIAKDLEQRRLAAEAAKREANKKIEQLRLLNKDQAVNNRILQKLRFFSCR
eukprot:TRINITY_DN6303_c0_g1_i1.p8 TRINITY_DN6303_c0_g1~~TRINITY_DN6303_c0_g1_i1.p8  ORF type:complete len:122 (-),score=20.40 TRINITY_DN6303_c0_g1_i1:160-525(-)